ncbi:chemotaxis protein CheZ [Arboricoccus pini]|uniref:Chemotaxis protein CheZ n=1 Tax=Arboricoccus pini TaxID=1963835 RepID=A0A212R6X6_9PROT|nr:protein phosphatase CheZ [Arboricoccus pini]SNB67946.1 chemotaxis protein CheZ [Arboricoccus pini]
MSDGLEIENLRHELAYMTGKIDDTMREISMIRHPMMSDDRVNAAVDELGAIVAATEVATGEILDVAEKLEETVPGAATSELTTRLFEACNFQDITGQRINKVMTLLRDIDGRLHSMIATLGEERLEQIPHEQVSGEAALLNGPAVTGALAQNSIDELFN